MMRRRLMMRPAGDELTWERIRQKVVDGTAQSEFPPGTIFQLFDSRLEQNIPMKVMGHNQYSAVDSSVQNTMTLVCNQLYPRQVRYATADALRYAEDELVNGTWKFRRVSNGGWLGYTSGKTVPKGGQLTLDGGSDGNWLTGKHVVGRTAPGLNDQIIRCVVGNPVFGALHDLGEVGIYPMTHLDRIDGGSNNYAQSVIRQWLNSSELYSNVYHPISVFDRYLSMEDLSGGDGLMCHLAPDFLAVVQTARVPCQCNNVYENRSLDGTTYTTGQSYECHDKFFLPSVDENVGVVSATRSCDPDTAHKFRDSNRASWDSNNIVSFTFECIIG